MKAILKYLLVIVALSFSIWMIALGSYTFYQKYQTASTLNSGDSLSQSSQLEKFDSLKHQTKSTSRQVEKVRLYQ